MVLKQYINYEELKSSFKRDYIDGFNCPFAEGILAVELSIHRIDWNLVAIVLAFCNVLRILLHFQGYFIN